jgi:hypothetical protein
MVKIINRVRFVCRMSMRIKADTLGAEFVFRAIFKCTYADPNAWPESDQIVHGRLVSSYWKHQSPA